MTIIKPLCVDLDGTLIYEDSIRASFYFLFRKRIGLALLSLPLLIFSKKKFKHHVVKHACLDVDAFSYNDKLLQYLASEKANGRSLILVTASDHFIAKQVADKLNLFDEVVSSTAEHGLTGRSKVEVLTKRYGQHGFDYAGNHHNDLSVWQAAHSAIVVNADAAVLSQAKQNNNVIKVF